MSQLNQSTRVAIFSCDRLSYWTESLANLILIVVYKYHGNLTCETTLMDTDTLSMKSWRRNVSSNLHIDTTNLTVRGLLSLSTCNNTTYRGSTKQAPAIDFATSSLVNLWTISYQWWISTQNRVLAKVLETRIGKEGRDNNTVWPVFRLSVDTTRQHYPNYGNISNYNCFKSKFLRGQWKRLQQYFIVKLWPIFEVFHCEH